MAEQQSSIDGLTARVARRVRGYRKIQDMSACALSERGTEIGYPIARNTIANLESGRKSDVSLREAVTLAAALGVSVADLIGEAVDAVAFARIADHAGELVRLAKMLEVQTGSWRDHSVAHDHSVTGIIVTKERSGDGSMHSHK